MAGSWECCSFGRHSSFHSEVDKGGGGAAVGHFSSPVIRGALYIQIPTSAVFFFSWQKFASSDVLQFAIARAHSKTLNTTMKGRTLPRLSNLSFAYYRSLDFEEL